MGDLRQQQFSARQGIAYAIVRGIMRQAIPHAQCPQSDDLARLSAEPALLQLHRASERSDKWPAEHAATRPVEKLRFDLREMGDQHSSGQKREQLRQRLIRVQRAGSGIVGNSMNRHAGG